MIIGSPVMSAVSGPGSDEMNAIALPSGDQVIDWPRSGSGALDEATGATNARAEPSGCTIQMPSWLPSVPANATHRPSCDQCGSDARALSSPTRIVFRLARSMSQSWAYGRPGWSRMATVYSIVFPSGASATSRTARNRERSLLWRPCAPTPATGPDMPITAAATAVRYRADQRRARRRPRSRRGPGTSTPPGGGARAGPPRGLALTIGGPAAAGRPLAGPPRRRAAAGHSRAPDRPRWCRTTVAQGGRDGGRGGHHCRGEALQLGRRPRPRAAHGERGGYVAVMVEDGGGDADDVLDILAVDHRVSAPA